MCVPYHPSTNTYTMMFLPSCVGSLLAVVPILWREEDAVGVRDLTGNAVPRLKATHAVAGVPEVVFKDT